MAAIPSGPYWCSAGITAKHRDSPEPAWHRRLRAKRAEHRRLLAAVGAAADLSAHHGTAGSSMAPNGAKKSTASGKGYWKCYGCQYMVPYGDYYCNGCGHQPPASVSRPAGGKQLAGSATAGKQSKALEDKDKELRKARQQVAEAKAAAAAAEAAKAEALAKAEAAGAASTTAAPAATETTEESKEVQAKLKSVRDKIKAYRALDASVCKDLFEPGGGYEAVMGRLQQELVDLAAVKRGARPLKDQIESATNHEKNMAKQHQLATERCAEIVRQLAELQGKLQVQQAAVQQCADRHSKAKAELCELTARFAEAKRDEVVGLASPPAPANGFVPGAALWKSMENLVRFVANPEVLAALGAAGMAEGEFSNLQAEIRTIQAAAAEHSPQTYR